MSAPKTHEELAKQLKENWIDNTDCDPLAAEIRADMDMGAMHDAGECPVCLQIEAPRKVESFDDLTADEVEICREISRQEYLLTSLPAHGATQEQMAKCVQDRYDKRLELVRSINPESGVDWDVHTVSAIMDGYEAHQREMDLADAEIEAQIGRRHEGW